MALLFNRIIKIANIMKEINLTQGKVALVDDEDFEALNVFKWYANKIGKTFYVARKIRVDGKRTAISMHWEIMGRKWIDHIDHNGCNNQKANLRFCTNQENQMNQRKQANTSSIYKGVYFNKQADKWEAYININGVRTYLGRFTDEVESARAYDNKAKIIFGEFAVLNLID